MAAPASLPAELRRVVLSQWRAYAIAAGFSAVVSVLMIVPSLFSMQVYDRVLSSRNEVTLWMLCGITLGLYLLMSLLDWARGEVLLVAAMRIDAALGTRVFDAAFHRGLRQPAAGTPAQAQSDLANVRQFIGGPPMHALFDLPWLPLYLLVLYLVHPTL
jgi:ATP-binding cassette subfamily C exporter for protease/lipase